MITKERKSEIVKEYGRKENDTGSPEVQIALLTERINYLTDRNQFVCGTDSLNVYRRGYV